MQVRGSRKLAAVIAAGCVLSGGAGALAATQLGSSSHQAYLNDVASRLNVTPTALTNAMKQAQIDQIDAAEKAGKLTAAQAKAARARINAGHAAGGSGGPGGFGGHAGHGGWWSGPAPGGHAQSWQGRFGCGGRSTKTTTNTTTTATTTTGAGTTGTTTTGATARPCLGNHGFQGHAGFGFGMGGGPGMGSGPGMGFGFGWLAFGGSAVTGYLGISAETLRSDLASGKTLAQIASATSGKSVSGLESAVEAAYKAQLDKAVSAGRMTSAQETKALSALSARLSKLVTQSFKNLGTGHFHGSRFHGFPHP